MAMAAFPGAGAQPSPGYYPSSRFRPIPFNRGYTNKWGPQHQTLSGDHSALTIWLDKTCGMFISISTKKNSCSCFYNKKILALVLPQVRALSLSLSHLKKSACSLASCLWCGSLTCSDLVLVSRCRQRQRHRCCCLPLWQCVCVRDTSSRLGAHALLVLFKCLHSHSLMPRVLDLAMIANDIEILIYDDYEK